MLRGRFLRPVDLNQDKASGIIGLLDDIESRDSNFPNALRRVVDTGFFESVSELGLNASMDMNDEHSLNFSDSVSTDFCILLVLP